MNNMVASDTDSEQNWSFRYDMETRLNMFEQFGSSDLLIEIKMENIPLKRYYI